ncbi:MAG: DUF4215 domain-containing protein [Nannocystis sp.]|nr:DUF4215 domain-containing protein [Nannocystis sp.]
MRGQEAVVGGLALAHDGEMQMKTFQRSLWVVLLGGWVSGCAGDDSGGTFTTATTTTTSTTGQPTTSSASDTDATTGDDTTSDSTTTSTSTSTSETTSSETTSVMPPACGDAVVDAGEECDDGNTVDGDACTNACTNAACGDGIVQEGVEACDDGNDADDDGCLADCTLAACGDGFVQAEVEECDDGNDDNADMCVEGCKLAICGDGFVQMDVETCDDGNNSQPSPAVRPRSAAPSLLGSDRRSAGVFAFPLRAARGPPSAGNARTARSRQPAGNAGNARRVEKGFTFTGYRWAPASRGGGPQCWPALTTVCYSSRHAPSPVSVTIPAIQTRYTLPPAP